MLLRQVRLEGLFRTWLTTGGDAVQRQIRSKLDWKAAHAPSHLSYLAGYAERLIADLSPEADGVHRPTDREWLDRTEWLRRAIDWRMRRQPAPSEPDPAQATSQDGEPSTSDSPGAGPVPSLTIVDRTGHTAEIFQTRDGRNIFSHGNTSARRSLAGITGIMLHQTAFFTNSVERMDTVIANYAVMPDGTVLKLRDETMRLNSIGTNEHAIDIEFVGNYPSAAAIARSGDGGLPTPPPVQIAAGRALVQHLQTAHGLSHIHAHAQFTRKNCPGPQLWFNVGEWAVANLGMSPASGNEVPDSWRQPSLALGAP
jgi:hypothetical protein